MSCWWRRLRPNTEYTIITFSKHFLEARRHAKTVNKKSHKTIMTSHWDVVRIQNSLYVKILALVGCSECVNQKSRSHCYSTVSTTCRCYRSIDPSIVDINSRCTYVMRVADYRSVIPEKIGDRFTTTSSSSDVSLFVYSVRPVC